MRYIILIKLYIAILHSHAPGKRDTYEFAQVRRNNEVTQGSLEKRF